MILTGPQAWPAPARAAACLALLLFAGAPAGGAPRAAGDGAALAAVPSSRFCVTEGAVDSAGGGSLHVDAGAMRGVMPDGAGAAAELAFTYRGPSHSTRPLASGLLRRQIGLKLRAQNTCNVLYVMWHIEPDTGIVVSVKNNPGKSLHKQCGAHGYANLTERGGVAVPPIEPGKPRTLRADVKGEELEVFADGRQVWKGALPPEALALEGPAGVRSDNGEFDFELRAPGGADGPACPPPRRLPAGGD